MLIVKTSAKPSAIQGVGLFAEEKIPKGTIIWKFNPIFDILFDPAEVLNMSKAEQELLNRYSYLSIATGKYVYSIDNSRFTNHSSIMNNVDVCFVTGEQEALEIANRDIEEGEEILVNYRTFDAGDETSTEEYLNS